MNASPLRGSSFLSALALFGFALSSLPVAIAAEAELLQLRSPQDYQVFQRADLGSGNVLIAGKWSIPRSSARLPDSLEARVLTSPTAPEAPTNWSPLPFNSNVRGFRAELPVPAGGWYKVQVRLLLEGTVLAAAEIAHVGVGEVFIIAGQSNSANHGEERQQPASGLVSAFDTDHWLIANDPQPGATGTKGSFIPSFGDALARRWQVPVGVICMGVGSTSVREWLPQGQPMSAPPSTGAHCWVTPAGKIVSSGELFQRLASRLRELPPNSVRALLWHQGESDWHQADGHNLPLAEFRHDLVELITQSRAAAGWALPWVVAQVSYNSPSNGGSEEQRAQQRSVVDGKLTFAGPNTDLLIGDFRENHGQGVHFSAAGQKRHGEAWAEAVNAYIEQSAKSERE